MKTPLRPRPCLGTRGKDSIEVYNHSDSTKNQTGPLGLSAARNASTRGTGLRYRAVRGTSPLSKRATLHEHEPPKQASSRSVEVFPHPACLVRSINQVSPFSSPPVTKHPASPLPPGEKSSPHTRVRTRPAGSRNCTTFFFCHHHIAVRYSTWTPCQLQVSHSHGTRVVAMWTPLCSHCPSRPAPPAPNSASSECRRGSCRRRGLSQGSGKAIGGDCCCSLLLHPAGDMPSREVF